MSKKLLAVDAGTGSVRAVLFDTDGVQLGCVQREWTHNEDPRYPGSMDFDWVKNWNLAKECISGVLEQTAVNPADIAAVSTTCMREGIVLYNKNREEIWACANVDARSGDEVSQLIKMNPALEREIYALSGQTYALGALPRILWVKNKLPDIYEKTSAVSMFNDWLIFKLSGTLCSEPSNACTSGIFNLKKRAWEPEIAEKCGLKADIFPAVSECGSVCAEVSELAAAQTGLAVGTPIVSGGGDAQLGCIGVGVVDSGQAAVFGGSFWQYEYNTDNVVFDKNCRVRINCHAVPDVWQYEALAFKPGLVMRWFRDAFCTEEKERAAQQNKDVYYLLDKKAENIPAGSYGMLCTFSDVMNYIGWKHASPTFTSFELEPEKYNKYTFYRAIMENTALVTLGHLKLVCESTGNLPTELVFAGGAAKSPMWCRILADTLGIPVKVPVVKEATALGAAVLAGYGAGIYSDISETAKKLVKWDKTYLPDMEKHKIYLDAFERWKSVYKAQMKLSDEKITPYMWCAPGVSDV